jgi:DsbC/DsbD-like thiol-disulfide interchange protein
MKAFFTLLVLLVSVFALAQQPQPVNWTFHLHKDKVTQGYTLEAKGILGQGWHVFTHNPGGDGLLIPTSLTLDHADKVTELSEINSLGKLITKEMEGVGTVNYFEHEAAFTLQFKTTTLKSIEGTLSYQLCNDAMCLPPTDVKFTLKLEE